MSRYITVGLITLLVALHTVLPCADREKVDISAGERTPNGDVVLDGVVFEKGDYYVTTTGDAAACPKPVARKCCPLGRGASGRKCVDVNGTFDADVWNAYHKIEGARAREMFRFKIGRINCTRPEVRVLVSGIGELDWTDNWHLRSVRNPTTIVLKYLS